MTWRILVILLLAFSCADATAQTAERDDESEGQSAVEAAIAQSHPFLRRFFEADKAYSREGSAKGVLALEALTVDPILNSAERALVWGKIAARHGSANEQAKAARALSSAKQARASATPVEVSQLGMDLDGKLLGYEATIRARQGNSLEAARLQRILERRVWEHLRQVSGDPTSAVYERARDDWLDSVVASVNYNIRVGRLSEYRDYARSIARDVANGNASPLRNARAAIANARAALAAGDHEVAIRDARKAIDLLKRAGQQDFAPSMHLARQTLVIALVSDNRFSDCGDEAEIMLAQFSEPAIAGAFSLDVAKGLHHACHGDFAAAESAAQSSIDFRIRRYGKEHYLTKEAEGQALFYRIHAQGVVENVSNIRRFVDRVAGSRNEWNDAQESPQYFVIPVMHKILDGIHASLNDGRLRDEELANLGFRITEWLKLNASQGALLDGAARLAAKTPDLRTLVEREQSLKSERAASIGRAYRLFNALEKTSKDETPDKDKIAKAEKALKAAEQQMALHENELAEVRRALTARFPAYREMVNPIPLTLEEVKGLLRKGEVYISTYATQRATLAWAMDNAGLIQIGNSAVGRRDLSQLVGRFRQSIERAATAQDSPLDTEAGRKLYDVILGPAVSARPAAEILIVSPDSVFGRIPLQALLAPDKTRGATSWLGDRWSVVNIPGATSLKLLRDRKEPRTNKSLAGFGDPEFRAAPITPAPQRVRTLLRGSGDQSATFDYSNVPPLPETRDELLAIASALGAKPEGNLFLGRDATRSTVLNMKLDDRSVLAFSTHGIKPGEVPRVTKSALAMAYEGAGLFDSLLTTDDILGLRLNADWVVLSACNTGSYTDDEDQTLSGLSRAFFLAGSRSMLVTHWAVESESAKRLVVETFRHYADGKSKVESLALAQRAMASGKLGREFTRPFFWAAYFLTGEPGR